MKKRNSLLDIMRIAATMVIALGHYQQYNGYTGFWYKGRIWFAICVEFFFLLSGYLSYHHIDTISNGNEQNFIPGKYIRLIPMALLASVAQFAAVMVHYFLFGDVTIGLVDMTKCLSPWNVLCDCFGVFSWIYPDSISAAWYISVLMFCYILFYVIIKLCKRIRVTPDFLFIAVFLFGLCIRVYGDLEFPLASFNMGRGYMMFFMGVLLAELLERDFCTNNRKLCLSVALVLVALVIGAIFYCIRMSELIGFDMTSDYEMMIMVILFPSLIIIAKMMEGTAFSSRILNGIAKASYETYLWHIPFIIWMQNIMWILNREIKWDIWYYKYLFVLFMFCVGYFVYYFIERKTTRKLMGKLEL